MKLEEEAHKFMEQKNKSTITASMYQSSAKETAIFPKDRALEYLTLGLVGESGEIANKIKKIIKDLLRNFIYNVYNKYKIKLININV